MGLDQTAYQVKSDYDSDSRTETTTKTTQTTTNQSVNQPNCSFLTRKACLKHYSLKRGPTPGPR